MARCGRRYRADGAAMARMRRPLVVAAALALLGLGLTTGGLLRPLQWLSGPFTTWRADRVPVGPGSDVIALRELAVRLHAENLELRRRLEEYAEVEARVAAGAPLRILCRSRVVARSGRRGRHFLEIDAGLAEGVERGLAVSSGWSLVGMVVGEQAGRSLVRLLHDPESRIPARLVDVDQTGEETLLSLGLCIGTGRVDRLRLDFVEQRPGLDPAPGMMAISAGGPEGIPPGLVLGRVVEVERSPDRDHWQIALEPLRPLASEASLLVLRSGQLP